MAEYLIQDTTLNGIADKIRVLSGSEATMTPAEMADELDVIAEKAIILANAGPFMPVGASWQSITYGNGKFFAITYGSDVAAYSEDGITWTQTDMPFSESWQSITYGNGKFVAIISGSAVAVYSEDGITWTQTDMPVGAYWQSITYGNGKFVAVADNSDVAAYSEDGITWMQTAMPVSENWYSVTYGNGKFVAVAVYGSGVAAYSEDGINWTQTTIPVGAHWQSITYGNGKFVAVADSSDVAAYSEDGINWTQTTMPISGYLFSAYGNGMFVAVSGGYEIESSEAAYSEDGIIWTQTTMPSSESWYSVTYGNGRFVAVVDSSDVAAYSIDGITWIHNTSKTLRKVDNTNVTEEVIQEIANVQEATTITPTTSNKVAVPSGTYASGDITVAGDSDLVAANIVEGKSIFNITGTAEPASALESELTTQDNLITQLTSALKGKAGVTSGGGSSASITIKSGENFSCEGPPGLSGGFVPCLSYTFEEDVFFQAGSTIIIDDESVVM